MIKTRFAVLAIASLLAVAACGGSDEQVQEMADRETPETAGDMSAATGGMENPHGQAAMPGADGTTRISYACPDGTSFQLTLLEGAGMARLALDGETIELKQEPAASGMKYSDGTWTFHGKGPEALIMRGEETVHSDCKAAGHP